MIAMLLYGLADLAVRVLPAPVADGLAIAAARVVFAVRPGARAALEGNLPRVVGDADPRRVRALARRAFEHFALSFVDFLRLGRLDPTRLADTLVVHGERHLASARASGRGVILLSAHLGNWEWGAAWLASAGPPLHVVARPHRNASVERFFQRRRDAFGVRRLLERPTWRAAARVLRRREWVALMVDRAPGGSAPACAWAAALARRTGALVLPAVMVRLPDRRYAAFIEPPLAPEQAVAHDFRATMGRWLRRYPAQWSGFEPLPEGLA